MSSAFLKLNFLSHPCPFTQLTVYLACVHTTHTCTLSPLPVVQVSMPASFCSRFLGQFGGGGRHANTKLVPLKEETKKV